MYFWDSLRHPNLRATGLLKVSGPQMMIGVIRERIAEMTSRGPWPTAHLNFIPIQLNIENP